MTRLQLSEATSLQLQDTATHYDIPVEDLIGRLLKNDQVYSKNPEQQNTNEHIRLAISAARLGIWTLDLATGVLEWNDELLKIYGITREEFKHREISFQERVHPDDREYVQKRLDEAFSGVPVMDALFRIVHPSGEIRYISGAATPIVRDGEVVMIIGNNLDVTEIRRAQQLIVNQNTILENISDAVIITDLDFHIISWNKRAEIIYGYTADEVLNKRVDSVLSTIYAGSTTGDADTQLRDQGHWQDEVIQSTRAGKQVIISSSVTMIKKDATTPPVIVAVNRDISASKRAEQLELEQEALRRSIDQERETSAFRAKMLSTIAHEFRTPLANIQSSSEILVNYGDRLTVDKKVASLENIRREIAYVGKMLDDLRLIARSQRQSLVVRLEATDAGEFFFSLINNLTTSLKPLQSLVLDVDREIGRIRLDPYLIQIAVSNLISNAVKYSPENGQIVVTVSKTSEDLIVVRIIDQGIGIPESDQRYLFEPFFRADNVGTIPGSGLGLSIIKEMAQLHGGSITCDSTVGVGSTFTLCFRVFQIDIDQ
ncbi:MAG: PAS domain S-box protein [Chitinophagaceae bacterium]|nr:PAS domain S-box protein [Anaerolineae bacterium]